MALPVIIMLVLGAIFFGALILFFITTKKKPVDLPFDQNRPTASEPVSIEVMDAAAAIDEESPPGEPEPLEEPVPVAAAVEIEEPEKIQETPDIEPEIEFDKPVSEIDHEIPPPAKKAASEQGVDFGSIFESEGENAEPLEFSFDQNREEVTPFMTESEEKEEDFEFVFGSSVAVDQESPAQKTPVPPAPPVIRAKSEPTPEDIFDAIDSESTGAMFDEPIQDQSKTSYPSAALAEPDAEVEEPAPKVMDPEEEKAHEKAKRIARVIINDIRNYNPEKLAEGIQTGNIMKTLGVEIERGRQLYIKRVSSDIAKSTNYYRENLIKILADGRPDLFGW